MENDILQPKSMPQALPPQPQPTQITKQSVPVSSDEVYANVMQEERLRNLISQTSPDVMLVDLQWRIKGYIKDPVLNQYAKIDPNTPEPSSVLVSKFISYLSALLSDNTRMSNLSANEINKIMGLTIAWVVDDLDSHAELYGLETDYTERTRIGHIVLNSTFMALKRAMDGQESKRIFKAISISEGLSDSQSGKSKSDPLKFWKSQT